MQVTPAHDPILTTPSHLAHALLARAHSPTTATKLFTTKIKQKPLLLHASSPSDKRALRRHVRTRRKQYFLRKQKPQALSAKEKRSLGVHDLQRKECKYAIYRGLHRMWVGYIREVLGLNIEPATNRLVTQQGHGSLLASADFHGAEVQVARSTCVDRVGLKGIVVRDTKFTFVIVTSQDEVKSESLRSVPSCRSGSGWLIPFCHILRCVQPSPKRTRFFGSRYQCETASKIRWRSSQQIHLKHLARGTWFSSCMEICSQSVLPTGPTRNSSGK